MDAKTPMEVSARRRRISRLSQQERKAPHQDRSGGNPAGNAGRMKAASKPSSAQHQNPMTNAVAPTCRQRQKSNSYGNANGASGRGKKKNRFSTSSWELNGDVQRPMQAPPPMTSRVAFGRTCPGAQPTMAMTQPAMGTLTSRSIQKPKLETPRPRQMQAAHEQLEVLLTRIEQDTMLPPPRRRKPPPARTVRRQMEHPPPVPTVTPLGSARGRNASGQRTSDFIGHTDNIQVAATAPAVPGAAPIENIVPLTQNPHSLAPGKRRALLELLSRAEQHDQEIVNMLRSDANDAGDPSKDTMRLTLQMLPLALTPGKSPYRERFWAGHRYLTERQRLHQQLQPDDLRYKEVKILCSPNGQFFLSKTLEEELKDEKHVLDFIESELQRGQLETMPPEQRARRQKAMDERVELDRQKQQVSEWRIQHRIAEQKQSEPQVTKRMLKKAKQLKQQKQEQATRDARRQQLLALQMHNETEEQNKCASYDDIQNTDDILNKHLNLESYDHQDIDNNEDDNMTPRPSDAVEQQDDELSDSLKQRQQFHKQCQRSNLYSNPKCLTPWKMFSTITNAIVGELTANIDTDLHRIIANFIKDFVENETSLAKQTN